MTGSSQIADPECISYEATEIFARQLTSEWTREKTPYRFDDALERARSASEEDTARIFLDAGFSAWLAYFLATNSSTRYYKGQQAEQQTLAAFERLSTENRKVVATKLFNTKAHDTVRPMIEQLSNRLKRRRVDNTEPSLPISPRTTVSTTRPRSETQSRLTANHQTISDCALGGTAEPGHTTTTTRSCSVSVSLPSETLNSVEVTKWSVTLLIIALDAAGSKASEKEFPDGGLVIRDARLYAESKTGYAITFIFATAEVLAAWPKIILPNSPELVRKVVNMESPKIGVNFAIKDSAGGTNK
ncbi:hypothetical protein BU26DRAFT_556993 [Trematosphaeria pertusa]|uniref:Uncharacterized protein n=1 Tax=Trematosphaeria pertusa TaxID=390896 RepID=A0A6A6HPY7_9PLEO|nr:uncharacterized protein BU26DRAFT_556993 [Trematosphaeria pertusa]KAF2240204.1 hypothetical protein BU26DRAFT_556993 [Trematosphaeria pertusa]